MTRKKGIRGRGCRKEGKEGDGRLP